MRIHWLQHVPFEGLGMIEPWATERGHILTATRLFENEALPLPGEVDLLIIMGGPMGVHDQARHPWLEREKLFLEDYVRSGKPALGICLGAQLLAHVLGAEVSRNPHPEIGWWRIHRSPGGASIPWPEECDVFHWHGDRFALPDGAELLCSSEACDNQGFVWKGRVVGLQFHLEMTQPDIQRLCDHARDEIVDSPYIQPVEQLAPPAAEHQERLRTLLHMLLDGLSQQARAPRQ